MGWAGTPPKLTPEEEPAIAPERGTFDYEVTVRAQYFTDSPVLSAPPVGTFEPGTHVLVHAVERFGDSRHVQVSISSGLCAWVSKSALRRRGAGAADHRAVSCTLESRLSGAAGMQQRERGSGVAREDLHWENPPARFVNHGMETRPMRSWKHARPARLPLQHIEGRGDEVLSDGDECEDVGIGFCSELFSGPPAEPKVLLKCNHCTARQAGCMHLDLCCAGTRELVLRLCAFRGQLQLQAHMWILRSTPHCFATAGQGAAVLEGTAEYYSVNSEVRRWQSSMADRRTSV